MRNLFFTVGSLGVAIGAALLAVALLAVVFVGRELSGVEKVVAGAVACMVGGAWWAAMQRKLRQRREG
ncbi:MAG TPA: hypothetical protein VGJ72_08845 [Polaromonas sp.]|jgi:hypothetical protein